MRAWGILFGLLFAGTAFAHDHWISDKGLVDPESGQWCCDKDDCAPIPQGGIKEAPGGYLIAETGELIPYARVIWKSPEGRWWRCRYLNDAMFGTVMRKKNSTRCLIGPPPGS